VAFWCQHATPPDTNWKEGGEVSRTIVPEEEDLEGVVEGRPLLHRDATRSRRLTAQRKRKSECGCWKDGDPRERKQDAKKRERSRESDEDQRDQEEK